MTDGQADVLLRRDLRQQHGRGAFGSYDSAIVVHRADAAEHNALESIARAEQQAVMP
jgi:hypothetical protein